MHQHNWQRLRSDDDFKAQLRLRATVTQVIRYFFVQQGFLEVDTPLLVENPGTEPYLDVFKTTLHSPDHSSKAGYLTTSPELHMKKLLAAGLGNMFQICKSFRNQEGLSDTHNPEFTILEWYRIQADYTDIMQDFEQLLLAISRQLSPESPEILTYQGVSYNLAAPWERISIAGAFERYVGIDTETLLSESELIAVAAKKGYQVDDTTTWEQAFHQLLLNEIEPHLGKTGPTILYDYPASQAALSKRKTDDPRFAERFEVFMAGVELGNAFSELTDWQEQQTRMQADLAERARLGKELYDLDTQFIAALKQGMPETGGIAVGVDRLVMLFADAPSIKDTLALPVEDVFELNPLHSSDDI